MRRNNGLSWFICLTAAVTCWLVLFFATKMTLPFSTAFIAAEVLQFAAAAIVGALLALLFKD